MGAKWETLWHDVKHSWLGGESKAPCSWSNYSTNSNPQLDTKWRCCRVFLLLVRSARMPRVLSVDNLALRVQETQGRQAVITVPPQLSLVSLFRTSHTLQDRHFCFIRQLSISTDVWLQVRFHLYGYGYEEPDSNSDMATDISVAMSSSVSWLDLYKWNHTWLLSICSTFLLSIIHICANGISLGRSFHFTICTSCLIIYTNGPAICTSCLVILYTPTPNKSLLCSIGTRWHGIPTLRWTECLFHCHRRS